MALLVACPIDLLCALGIRLSLSSQVLAHRSLTFGHHRLTPDPCSWVASLACVSEEEVMLLDLAGVVYLILRLNRVQVLPLHRHPPGRPHHRLGPL